MPPQTTQRRPQSTAIAFIRGDGAPSVGSADQVPLFAAMKTRPVLFTEAQLAGNIAEDYRPGARRKAP